MEIAVSIEIAPSNSKLESHHSSVTLGSLNIRLLSIAQLQRFHGSKFVMDCLSDMC
jgi:hypothetical protein